jgi:hyperosmotically inducible protein
MNIHSTKIMLLGLALAAGVGLSLSAVAQSDSVETPALSDSAITAKVKAAIVDDSQLQGSHIKVTTDHRVVTLHGMAMTDEARAHAVRVAEDVRGVDSVDDELSIGSGSGSEHRAVAKAERIGSDSWITTKVKSELLSNNVDHGFDVHVKTLHGVVMLSGALPDEDAIAHARDIAGQVQGVQRVDSSELHVAAGG